MNSMNDKIWPAQIPENRKGEPAANDYRHPRKKADLLLMVG
jgi:hypothetical protein